MDRACGFHLAPLRAAVRPFRLHFFPRLRSTNDHALALRRRGKLFAPAIVLTSHQSHGRGRGANRWWSGKGSLTATFVLPVEEHLSAHQLPLIAGLAVRNAVAQITGKEDIGLKWPNDLVYKNRKLAGVLCERALKVDLVGVGINVNLQQRVPESLGPQITSLDQITGTTHDLGHALATVARHLQQMLLRRHEHSFAGFLREYDQHHVLRRRKICIVPSQNAAAVRGVCLGLDNLGRLLVRGGGKVHKIVSGHVRWA